MGTAPTRRLARGVAGLALAALLTTACAASGADAPGGGDGAGTGVTGEVTVLAAASLTDAFEAIGRDFEQAHPDATVRFSFAGSQRLAAQVLAGAPADVFASANAEQMDVVVEADATATTPTTFARNRLAIAVEPGNPRRIDGLADLAAPDLTVVMAAAEVPAGRYAAQALETAGVEVAPASLETDVRAVLAKVALGEADAGIVYASDVAAAGDDVDAVPIADAANVLARYPIAPLAEAPNPDGARAFVELVLSEPGRARLADHGFSAAP